MIRRPRTLVSEGCRLVGCTFPIGFHATLTVWLFGDLLDDWFLWASLRSGEVIFPSAVKALLPIGWTSARVVVRVTLCANRVLSTTAGTILTSFLQPHNVDFFLAEILVDVFPPDFNNLGAPLQLVCILWSCFSGLTPSGEIFQ